MNIIIIDKKSFPQKRETMLIDNHGREINYLRLAVTDRCNLRCKYCMPKEGLDWLPRKELMTYEEMTRICSLLAEMGVEKVRITGGEPFMRRELTTLLKNLSRINRLRKLSITTNGTLTAPYIPELKKIGITSVNLSLDTLDPERFKQIARRDGLDKVLKTLEMLLDHDITVKINTVVMENRNIADIIPLVQLTKISPVIVRFIEEMPFNGGSRQVSLNWNYERILEHIQKHFPSIEKITDAPHSTSYNYHIPRYKGNIGIIAAYSRLFCGSCNRIRITPTGKFKTCLYGPAKFNIKDAMREGKDDEELKNIINQAVLNKEKDGWEAQEMRRNDKFESMAAIGG
jgi:cyclic pyranopterin phosphate synthase